jgi:hypothetical protein
MKIFRRRYAQRNHLAASNAAWCRRRHGCRRREKTRPAQTKEGKPLTMEIFKTMATVALKMSKMNAPALIILAKKIHDMMSANASVFADPFIGMAALLAQVDSTDTAQQNMVLGGKPQTAIRNQELKKLKAMLTALGRYVQNISQGDVVIINQAGMDVKKYAPRKYETIAAPEEFIAKPTTTEGVARLSWKTAANVTNYEVQWCPNPVTDAGWKRGKSTRSSSIYQDSLASGLVWFRVRGFSAAGESDWSAVVSSKVL